LPSPADDTFARALAALQAGEVEDAERLFKKTLRLQPRHVAALNLYGVLLTQMERYEEAEPYVRRAIEENPNSDATFYNYGVILKALKRFDEAVQQFSRALAINGAVPETFNARGGVYLELEQPEKALADFDKALSFNPRFIDALVNKARVTPKENAAGALRLAEQALALQPNHGLAWLARGNAFNDLKRYDDAIESFARALALQPDLAQAWLGRGDALRDLRRLDEAKAAYEKVLSLEPDLAPAHDALGVLLLEMGRIDDAALAIKKAIELDSKVAIFYLNLASAKKFKAGDPEIAAMEAIAETAPTMPKENRMILDFALGRAYADIRDYRRSFQHLLAANKAHRSTLNYNVSETISYFENIEKTFSRDLIAAKSGAGVPSPRPIFIIGMPRSGSTLLEQILSSHPSISAAGEVPAFSSAVNDVLAAASPANADSPAYPAFVPLLSESTLKAIGQKYITLLANLAPERERATDKMLGNFTYAGLIHLTLPNAIILHAARNPVDSCISCFTLKFKGHHDYAYDLAELGQYYKRYQRLMQHWHEVLPPGRILDVQYEEVIADLEGQARRIIAHCGLPWDDRCLAFHKNDRAVRTASVAQVRQPIYKSSVDRWRVYEEFLGPLLKELGIDPQAAA
jgi:tetratricopeptide (TPR) repeat protein